MLRTTVHPGVHLKELLAEWKITQSALARHIGVKVGVINEVCNGRRGISPQLAQRLAVAFGSSVDFWLNLQVNYDLSRSKVNLRFGKLIGNKAA